jgi:hypothetical protein
VVCEILEDRGAQLDFTTAFYNALTHFKGGERSSRSWAAREIIFARSSIGRAAQDTKALSAVAKASIIS